MHVPQHAPNANMLAAGSMSAADIQTFLNGQPGLLKSATFRPPDHNGVRKSAAQMIYDAAHAWGLSPKVILVTVQKEQALLSTPDPSQHDWDWAMGAGYTDSQIFTKDQGFGKQIWIGTNNIAKLAAEWKPGMSKPIEGTNIVPADHATWGLYRYTPHFAGNMSFWMIWWRHFGNPLQ